MPNPTQSPAAGRGRNPVEGLREAVQANLGRLRLGERVRSISRGVQRHPLVGALNMALSRLPSPEDGGLDSDGVPRRTFYREGLPLGAAFANMSGAFGAKPIYEVADAAVAAPKKPTKRKPAVKDAVRETKDISAILEEVDKEDAILFAMERAGKPPAEDVAPAPPAAQEDPVARQARVMEREEEKAGDAIVSAIARDRQTKARMREIDLLPKLSHVPVYSVTNSKGEVVHMVGAWAAEEGGGSKGRKKALGMFFMNEEDARAMLKKVKGNNPLISAEVTRTTMDQVVKLVDKTQGNPDVAFRIMPDHREVINALTVYKLHGMPMQQVNGVPVFQANGLTVNAEGGQTLLPLFLSKADLIAAWEVTQKNLRFTSAKSRDDLEANLAAPKVEVGTLEEVIESMRSQLLVDEWSKVVIIPPGGAAKQDDLTGADLSDQSKARQLTQGVRAGGAAKPKKGAAEAAAARAAAEAEGNK